MTDVQRPFVISPLDPVLAQAAAGMTFPAYRHLLALQPAPRHPEQGDVTPVQPFGCAARVGPTVAGMALAELPSVPGGHPELLSLYVAPGYRQRGLASAMVAWIEAAVAERGFEVLQATYMTGRPSIDIVERIFARRGWSAPVMRTMTVRFTPEEARTTPWFGRIGVPRGGVIVPWTELRPEQRSELVESNRREPWIAEGLEPWQHDQHGFHEASSVGLTLGDRVVGWVINHQIDADTVRFTCSFMRRDLARRAAILPLYTASIERVEAAGGRYGMFITPVKYTAMIEFVRQHCAPYISFVGETRGVEKALAPAVPPAPTR
jgi:GNAT superfamily N-acetyltransferase